MNRQPKLLGLDIGFGFTKCLDGDGTVITTSHLRPCREENGGDRPPPESGYRVELIDGCYRVARDGRGVSLLHDVPRRPDRLFGHYAKGLALTAAALLSEGEAPLRIVVGLPLAEIHRWQDRLRESLIGFHKIGLETPTRPSIRKNVHIQKIHVVPHPLGAFINLIMNRDGKIRRSENHQNKIALIDVGFRTTNLMVMEAGRFCNRGSATIEMGIADGLEAIARKLRREIEEDPDMGRLYRAVGRGYLRVADQSYNLTHLRGESYRRLAEALADQINFRLRGDWDLEHLLLTGGGGVDLAADLAPLLEGEVDLIEHDQDVRLCNAQGYLSLARHIWGRSGLCNNVDLTWPNGGR